MDVILRVAGCAPAHQTAAFARRVEEAGFTGIGIPDSQLIMRDIYVNLALAAQQTSHLLLYTAVTNPLTRHVSVLASAVQTVEELAPGRVRVIVGSGYSSVMTIGRRAATIREMRETVVTLRRLLSGERVSLGGFEAHLPYASGRDIPILIAATGPRTIELAGEVADGVLILVGIHPEMMDTAWRAFESGAKRAGRDPHSLEVIYASRVFVEKDMETARALARPICAQWVVEPYHAHWLREAGLDIPDIKMPPELASLYPDIPHAENWEEARSLTSFLSDKMLAEVSEVIGIFGTAEHCAGRLDQLQRNGLGRLYAMSIESYSFPESTLQAFRDEIFPRLTA